MVRAFIPALRIDDRAAWEAWWMGADRGGVWREPIRKPCAGCGSWFSGAWQSDGSIAIEAHVCSGSLSTIARRVHRGRLGGLRP